MNIRLVVIDDEIFVRRGIISSVDWERHGIEIAGEATDGLSGLELIRKVLPHIILTDIRMPNMDGLELIRVVRKEMPKVKILILSVLEDFQTVREALRLGVVDYVQKLLMTPEELLNVVLKIKESFVNDLEMKSPAVIQVTSRDANDDDLWKWLQGAPSESLCALLKEGLSFLVGRVHFQRRNPDQLLAPIHGSKVVEELNDCLRHSADPLLKNMKVGRGNEDDIWLFITGNNDRLSLDKVKDSLNLLRDQNSDLILSIGLSRVFAAEEERILAHKQADCALEQRFYDGDGKAYMFHESASASVAEVVFFNQQNLKNYHNSLETDDDEQSMLAFAQLFPLKIDATISQKAVRDGIYHWVSSVMLYLKERGGHLQGAFPDDSPFEQIHKLVTYPALQEWCHCLHEVARAMLSTLKNSHRSEIMKAINYIQTYYMNAIRIKDIAAWVNLSENYFCYLFTKETGKTFGQFLQEVRVDIAKGFLRLGHTPWVDIGEKVGFDNPKYFAKIFKKYTGVTPIQYARARGN